MLLDQSVHYIAYVDGERNLNDAAFTNHSTKCQISQPQEAAGLDSQHSPSDYLAIPGSIKKSGFVTSSHVWLVLDYINNNNHNGIFLYFGFEIIYFCCSLCSCCDVSWIWRTTYWRAAIYECGDVVIFVVFHFILFLLGQIIATPKVWNGHVMAEPEKGFLGKTWGKFKVQLAWDGMGVKSKNALAQWT